MATSKPSRKRSAVRAARPAANGMVSFAMHRGDPAAQQQFRALREGRRRDPGFAGLRATAGAQLSKLDPETAAWHHLRQALAERSIPDLTDPGADDRDSEFKSLGSEYLPLTGTRTVKFRQYLDKVPVYGSLVTVELDEGNECLAIRSVLGDPEGVDPVATVAPAAAAATAAKRAGRPVRTLGSVPRLYYFFDPKARRWRLAYIVENVPVAGPGRGTARTRATRLMDYVIDAHRGTLVAELPRTARLAPVTQQAKDALGAERTFECERKGGTRTLKDPTLNVATFDFRFQDPDRQEAKLPGRAVTNPPAPWPPSAVSAHANAEVVARFLRQVLGRSNIDNRGGAMTSSVNCVVFAESPDGKEWVNAYWNGRQMVYGQRKAGRSWLSMAANQDVVGHEMFHGVTDHTARLEYARESGALNESYSDIFGVIISNWSLRSIARWDWRIGEGLESGGKPFRDMSDPRKYGQPRTMAEYQELPNTPSGDWGGVHVNSGIHNYAAYRILTAGSGDPRRYVFRPAEVAALFYICLTQYLSRTSAFADSREGVLLAARTLFRDDPAATQQEKVRAIRAGFAAAGIVA
jgi:Zn-dependent metalloprotease